MAHKFAIGDMVTFFPKGEGQLTSGSTAGKITRLLPMDGGEYQYHVRLEIDGVERRATEDQLRAF
jgi:hypothetical protein